MPSLATRFHCSPQAYLDQWHPYAFIVNGCGHNLCLYHTRPLCLNVRGGAPALAQCPPSSTTHYAIHVHCTFTMTLVHSPKLTFFVKVYTFSMMNTASEAVHANLATFISLGDVWDARGQHLLCLGWSSRQCGGLVWSSLASHREVP